MVQLPPKVLKINVLRFDRLKGDTELSILSV